MPLFVVRVAVLLLGLMLPVLTGTASAQPKPPETAAPEGESPADKAKGHFKKGVTHFNLDEWREAMSEFRTGYRIYPDAIFLFNIAQCHRKLGEHAEALSFYKKYRREKPDAPNRDDVDKRIEELESLVAAQPDKPTAPPPASAPSPVPPPPAAPVPTPPTTSANVDASLQGPASDTQPSSVPIYKRWYFWAGIGGVVLLAAGVIILSSTSSSNEPTYFKGDLGSGGRIEIPTK